MRIYAASRSDVVKGALYMIGFVAVMDVAMVLFLEHVVHRTVTFTAQWPIGVLLVGVIAFTLRSFNQASRSWIQVTPKQLSWASGPKPASQGLTPTGSVKLSEVSAVSVQLDEIKARMGRKDVTLQVHRLHAEVEGKPTLVLPIAALESADTKLAPESLGEGRTLLLRAVEQINTHAKRFTVDTSVMGEVVLPGAVAGDEAAGEAAENGEGSVGGEGLVDDELVAAEAEHAEVVETEAAEFEAVELEAEPEVEVIEASVTEVEVVEPEVVEASVIEAEVAEPEVVEAAEPEVEVIEASAPEVEVVELEGAEASVPEVEVEVVEPEVVEEVEVIEPELVEVPEVDVVEVEPEVAEASVTEVVVIEPEVLEVAEPEAAAASIAGPDAAESETTEVPTETESASGTVDGVTEAVVVTETETTETETTEVVAGRPAAVIPAAAKAPESESAAAAETAVSG